MQHTLKALESPELLAIWPMMSVIIFISFFAVLLWRTLKMDKKHIKEMSDLPLNDNEN
ncbi:MAG: CcoQ/FixQ family Cbb3-type cytochrome c oxidase assembly chaperone [Candidatus Nephrothrix sp. EaCA]|nr:MAG: CcoQ/FixQ family Cbb3-type cytochrome c oxidase assembly chaperone [Candidatus Nephrothrix sp. EaCA]